MNGSLFPDPSSAAADWLTAHCDGGSRGNPGPSGYGAVIEDAKGRVLAELSEFVGIQTNNFAEYSGLLGVLRWAVEHGARRLRVVSDSELMVKQMQGKYAVKSPILRPLFEEARKLSRSLVSFEMRHTLRGGNKTADRLANQAMDRGMGKKQGIGTREQGTGVRDQGSGGSDQATESNSGWSAIPKVGKPSDFEAARKPVSKPASQSASKSAPAAEATRTQPAAKPARQILEGYVKDGVVHLLGGELPDGIFVKIIRE